MTVEWRDFALCKGVDPDAFYPEKTEPDYNERVAQAQAVCATCPVRTDCLAFAMDTHQKHGIFGGLTPSQRHHLRYPRKRVEGKLTYVEH